MNQRSKPASKKSRSSSSQTGSATASQRTVIPDSDRAIIWIDDAPLRSSAAREFKKVYRSYNQHVAALADHETVVRPAYYRWLSGVFGERLERMQALHSKLLQKSALLQRVMELFFYEDRSRGEAYREAEEELNAEADHDFEFRDQSDEAFEHEDADELDEDADDDEDVFSTRTGSRRENGFNRRFEEAMRESRRKEAEEAKSREARLKTYYRKLAQALHPDLAGPQTDLSRELWEETQKAYRERNLDQLELIYTLVSLQRDVVSNELRLFDVQLAIAAMTKKLNGLKAEKRKLAKSDPSWGFDKKNKTVLAATVRCDLDREEGAIETALAEIESELKSFEQSAKKKRKKRAREMSYDW